MRERGRPLPKERCSNGEVVAVCTGELYQLTRKYQIASLPLQQRGPLLRIHAPVAFGRPVHQKDRKGAFPEQSLQSTGNASTLPSNTSPEARFGRGREQSGG
jgi:hypothetical protein